jgi:predicted GNAT family N-acyltransferase
LGSCGGCAKTSSRNGKGLNNIWKWATDHLPLNFPVMKVDTRFYKRLLEGNIVANIIITTAAAERDTAFAIRRKVFIDEQKVPEELEIDAYDTAESTRHILAYSEQGQAVAAGRFRPYGGNMLKVERLAVLREARGSGVGKLVMQAIEVEAIKAGYKIIKLSAQLHAKEFYLRLGYAEHGGIYLDAGIEHVDMSKKI